MPKRSFRDRFFTPKVARAIMSPLGIVLFGVVGAGAILTGIAIPAALGLGVAAWAGKVALAVPRDKSSAAGVDAFALSEPWRSYVQGAQTAKARFDRIVEGTSAGPIRDRLATMSERLESGVEDCWKIASRGDDIDAALANLNTAQARLELAEARQQARQYGSSPSLDATIQSLEAQVASAQRMEAVSIDARDRLRLLDARLDELVARGTEVSVGAADSGLLDHDINDVVDELESLRQALEVTSGNGSTSVGTSTLPNEPMTSTRAPLPSGPAPLPTPQPAQPPTPRAAPQPGQEQQTWPPSP